MTATADLHKLRHLPNRLDEPALVRVLDQIKLLSPDVKKLAAAGAPLCSTAAIAITVAVLDEALKTEADLPVDQRIKLKNAMSAHGFFASANRKISNQGRL
jgi:hypothetical protein